MNGQLQQDGIGIGGSILVRLIIAIQLSECLGTGLNPCLTETFDREGGKAVDTESHPSLTCYAKRKHPCMGRTG